MRDKIIAVIFEVTPKDGQKGNYLYIVATLRLVVGKVEGFISVERIQYLTTQQKFCLSLSSMMKLPSTTGAKWPPIDPYNPNPMQKFLPITTCASVK